MASYFWGAKGRGREITLSHPERRKLAIKRQRCSKQWIATSSTWLAFRDTEDDLKILFRIPSIANITSLIHTRDSAGYAWTSLYTSLVHTVEDCQVIWQLAFQIGGAPFHPHVRCDFSFLWAREYRLPGAEISQHRRFTLRGIFRGVVTQQRGVIFVYIGDGLQHRFDLDRLEAAALELARGEGEALAQGQQVEF